MTSEDEVSSTVVEDTGRPARRTSRGEATRQRLLQAAVELLADNGVRGLTHRRAEERAGVLVRFYGGRERVVLGLGDVWRVGGDEVVWRLEARALHERGVHEIGENWRERVRVRVRILGLGCACGKMQCGGASVVIVCRWDPAQSCVLLRERYSVWGDVDRRRVDGARGPEAAEQEWDAARARAEVERLERPGRGRGRCESFCEADRPVFGLWTGYENRRAYGEL